MSLFLVRPWHGDGRYKCWSALLSAEVHQYILYTFTTHTFTIHIEPLHLSSRVVFLALTPGNKLPAREWAVLGWSKLTAGGNPGFWIV